MKILFFRSTWGLEEMPSLEAQLRKIKAGGFDGVEMAVPADAAAERVARAIRHSSAIRARIGHDQRPQIPDPRDLMWQAHFAVHLAWWKRIFARRRAECRAVLCVTPEFGPAPYMTLLPHTHQPIADLWDVNVFMRDWLKEQLPLS